MKERTRWREQALEWLSADLVARTKQYNNPSPDEHALAQERLRWWQQDPALASVRDAAAVAARGTGSVAEVLAGCGDGTEVAACRLARVPTGELILPW